MVGEYDRGLLARPAVSGHLCATKLIYRTMTMATPTGYSKTQIALHWVMALFLLGQVIQGEDMAHFYDDLERGVADATSAWPVMVWAHIIIGIAVLALVVWRLVLRFSRGVPAEAEGATWQMWLAKIVHLVLYAVMIVAPITGLLVWFGGVESLGDIHELAKPIVIVAFVLHFAGVLYHQFVAKDGLLKRMMKAG